MSKPLGEPDICPRCGDFIYGECETCGVRIAPPSSRENSVSSRYDDDEPDWESIAEARAEARAERDIELAEARYERWVYGD